MTEYIHPGIFCRGELWTYPNGEKSFLFDVHDKGIHGFIMLSVNNDSRFVYYNIRRMLLNVTASILTHGVSRASKHRKIGDMFMYATGGYDTNIFVQKHETN